VVSYSEKPEVRILPGTILFAFLLAAPQPENAQNFISSCSDFWCSDSDLSPFLWLKLPVCPHFCFRTSSLHGDQTGSKIARPVLLVADLFSSRLLTKSHSDILRTTITTSYGLYKRCDLTITSIPDPTAGGKLLYRKYECRKFPVQVTDRCEKENRAFCAAWTSAGYLDQIAIGFASISLVAILFGVSTHSRRRRIWRAVAVLVFLQGMTATPPCRSWWLRDPS
jgi:hypothetical protein